MPNLNYAGKYSTEIVMKSINLLNKGLPIREISKLTMVPETTIRNWKFGYSNLYGSNKLLNEQSKKEAINLLNLGYSIPDISKKLKINYDTIRLFLKSNLSEEEYSLIKISNRKLSKESKKLTPEFAYILGVMYGDGYFGTSQIRLGTKDKEFMNYFIESVEIWCKKKPSQVEFIQNDKPYYECYLSFKDAANFVKGIIEDREEVPKNLINSNDKEIIAMFVKGFSDSEGTIIISRDRKANFLKIYNQKKLILKQIKEMMLKLSFDDDKIKIVVNNKSKGGNVYALRICYRDQLELFSKKIGFTILRKQKKLEECLKR